MLPKRWEETQVAEPLFAPQQLRADFSVLSPLATQSTPALLGALESWGCYTQSHQSPEKVHWCLMPEAPRRCGLDP